MPSALKNILNEPNVRHAEKISHAVLLSRRLTTKKR